MATAVTISRSEIHDFLTERNFREIQIPGTHEMVMSRFVGPDLCLRVYTSVVDDSSRGTGEDAIRTVLVVRSQDQVRIIGADKRVHRVAGWRANLQNRLDNWAEQLGPTCPVCGKPTVKRRSKRGPFWGCSDYPNCRSIQPIVANRVAVG